MKNGVHLITYADSLGRNVRELHEFLGKHMKSALAGVHLLPFYPSSADRGFAPVTYDQVDPAFGSWDTVEALGDDFELTVDFMVNHVSAQSPWFKDWVEKGSESPWANLFLPVEKLFPNGITDEQRQKIYTRKPRDPWIPVSFEDGSTCDTWCTFSEEQIDIDVFSETGRRWLEEHLSRLCGRRGIRTVRLDAAGYATKKPGTQFFFEEPEIVELFNRCRSIAEPHGVGLLPEVHEHHRYQQKLAGWNLPVYDFALPMLLLHAVYARDARPLADWLNECPRESVTTLDTHDGIGVVDVTDLLTPEQIDFTVNALYEKGSNVNRRYSSANFGNLDIYQINCTYYSALGENDNAYIASRAVQFFAPGIPQVYYVGLLAGRNDVELVERTRQGRDINRHGYSLEEAEAELQRPVVRRLMQLMELRNNHPVFTGSNPVVECLENGRVLRIERTFGDAGAVLTVNFDTLESQISLKNQDGTQEIRI